MRILLVSDDMDVGGVPRHVADLARGLSQRGHFVAVAASPGPSQKWVPEGVPFVPVPILVQGSWRKNVFGILPTLNILRRTIHDYRCEIIHSHKRYADALARITARASGLPHISTCHNTFTDYRRITRFGDSTIACCEYVRNILVRDFHKQPQCVETVYNGMPRLRPASKSRLAQMRKTLGCVHDSRLIASVGGLSPAKDRITLVRAINLIKLPLRKHNAFCAIVGNGIQQSMIGEFIRANGIDDCVRIVPAADDIEAIAGIAEFFVLSSVQEGLPYVILEAASLAKPHIATDVGGVSEFIEEGDTGMLVPKDSPEMLADAMEFLLKSPKEAKRLGRNAKEKFEQQHDFDHFMNATINVYKKCSEP